MLNYVHSEIKSELKLIQLRYIPITHIRMDKRKIYETKYSRMDQVKFVENSL